jgi:hypothetical protein
MWPNIYVSRQGGLAHLSGHGRFLGRALKAVWTFVISGGSSFEVRVPFGRPLSHDGGNETLWQVLVSEEEAATLVYTIEGQGCQVRTDSAPAPVMGMASQAAKERAAKIAARKYHGGLVRRDLEIWVFFPDGGESLLTRSTEPDQLWQQALQELEEPKDA